MEAKVGDMSGLTGLSSASVPATISSDMGSASEDLSWSESFILEQLGIDGHNDDNVAASEVSSYELGFEIPQEVKTEEKKIEMAVPARAVDVSANQTSGPREENESRGSNSVQNVVQQKTKIRVVFSPKKDSQIDIENLSLCELRDLCLKQRNQIKSSERIITNMNKLVIEEQEIRTSFRKKRDETIRDHNRMKDELGKLTLMHEQLLREIEVLRRGSASDKLIIQQLEAKLADFKYENKKMGDQLKETGEVNVGKLKDEVRELKRLTKKYEKNIDEKNETISKLRNNLNELKAQMSKETGVRTDKKEIDDLKRMVSSQMMRMWSEMKKEIHGPSHRIVKNSPEYLSETDIEQIPPSSYASSTYSNDDYASYDSYTPSPASSLTSSISPPLSIASARSVVVTSEKSTAPSLSPSSDSPPLSDSCCSSVAKITSPAPSLKSSVSPPLETPSASVASSSETTMSNSTDKIPFSPPTSPSALNCSEHVRTNSSIASLISSPIVSEKDVCDDYSGNTSCKESLKLASSGASGTNHQKAKESIFETMFTLPSLQALESIDPVKSTIAVPTPVFLVEIEGVESCDNLSSAANTVKDNAAEPVESVPVAVTPLKVAPRTLETKQRSPKRRKVKANSVTRSIFALSDSDSDECSPDESDSKSSERKTTPKKFPSTFSVNLSPPRTRSQSRTPTPSPKKSTAGIFSPPKSVTKHVPSTRHDESSSSSDSEFLDSSDSEESSVENIISPSKVVTNEDQSLDKNIIPRPQVLQNGPKFQSEAHTDNLPDSGSTRTVSHTASVAPRRNALLSDDLRMSSDDDDLSSEEIQTPARDSMTQETAIRVPPKNPLSIENKNVAANESITLTVCEAKEMPSSHPTSMKAISPKRKLSFPCIAKGKLPPVVKKEESVLPARIQTMPSVFRPQKPLESVAVKRLRPVHESKSAQAEPEPLYHTECKRSRISRCTEAPKLKPAEAVKPNPPARSLPKLRPAIAPAVPKATIRTPESNMRAPETRKAISNGNTERKLSARERIGMSVQIVAVGSGENICDKRRLELLVKERVEKRKAEKVNGDAKQTNCGETGPRPVTKLVPPVRTALLRQSSAPIWKPPVGKAAPKAVESNVPAIRVPSTVESPPESMEIEPPTSLPNPARRIAAVTPVITRSLARKTSLPEIPKRTLSLNRTPVQPKPKAMPCDEIKVKAPPAVHPPVAAPSPASAALFLPVKSPGQPAPPPIRVPVPILSPVSTVENHAPCSKQVAVVAQSQNPLESKLKKPVIVPDRITMQKLLFGHYSRSVKMEDVLNQLKVLIESGQQLITPEAFAKATYYDFADSASNYMNSRANEHMIINGAERVCASMKALKELVPDMYAQLESQVVLHFCTEMISAPGRYGYQINDMLNQLAVSYGTVCRYFKLRELSFRLLLSVLISRPAQKFTFAHGFILAYPDLWSLPFDYGSLVERCILVGLMHGSLYTNSIYFKNVRCMVVDGIGVDLPTCSYAASFGALVDEFKELDFESAIQDSARAIGMLLLQANWMTSRKLIEEQTEKLLREWQEKKITDMILAVFLNTSIWVSELSRDCEPGFVDLLAIFSRINKQIDSLPSDEVSAQLSQAVKDGLLKISRLIERGPRTDPELVYYRIEDEQAVRKQIEKATHADKKKRQKYKKREAARQQKKLMDELARIDT